MVIVNCLGLKYVVMTYIKPEVVREPQRSFDTPIRHELHETQRVSITKSRLLSYHLAMETHMNPLSLSSV